jgi:hypothetical protein
LIIVCAAIQQQQQRTTRMRAMLLLGIVWCSLIGEQWKKYFRVIMTHPEKRLSQVRLLTATSQQIEKVKLRRKISLLN